MNRDHYDGAASGWAHGATLVYAPIAAQLVARSPIPLTGARVLDVGAGTGVSAAPLRKAGATMIVEGDLSYDMLAWNHSTRPPAVVSDVSRLPFPGAAFDAVVASFVLNHLTDPVGGLDELARTTRAGGAVLATVYANSSGSAARDAVDASARAHGWEPPAWYVEMKRATAPLLGDADRMETAATEAGLVAATADEVAIDVGLTEPGALVDYRFGQANFADWLASLAPDARLRVRAAAVEAIGRTMEPYRPRVVFLTARTGPSTS